MTRRRAARAPHSDRMKSCAVCGRNFAWRKKWQDCWDEVRHCSKACRGTRLTEKDHELERAIEALLDARQTGATICPSEVAVYCFGEDATEWRPQMARTRMAARRLASRGVIEITQRGSVVDPSRARGPIRLRRRRE